MLKKKKKNWNTKIMFIHKSLKGNCDISHGKGSLKKYLCFIASSALIRS